MVFTKLKQTALPFLNYSESQVRSNNAPVAEIEKRRFVCTINDKGMTEAGLKKSVSLNDMGLLSAVKNHFNVAESVEKSR